MEGESKDLTRREFTWNIRVLAVCICLMSVTQCAATAGLHARISKECSTR